MPHLTKIKHAITFQSRFNSSWPKWFEWGETIGLYSFIILVIMLANSVWIHPLIVAITLHIFVDFFVQTDDTSQKKLSGDPQALIVHSILSGGYPVLAFGLHSLPVIIWWSILAHFAIDASKKFGLRDPYGPVADQATHVVTLIILWSLYALQ